MDDTNIKTQGIAGRAGHLPQTGPVRATISPCCTTRSISDLDYSDYESATVSATYLFARNLRGNVEYTRDLDHEFNRMGLGFVSAF